MNQPAPSPIQMAAILEDKADFLEYRAAGQALPGFYLEDLEKALRTAAAMLEKQPKPRQPRKKKPIGWPSFG